MNKDYNIYNDTKIDYDFYSNYAKRNYSANCPYEFIYHGKENNPNVILKEGSQNKSYISSRFFIFSKNHDVQNLDENIKNDGELIIENTPITNSNQKLYLCFPLKTQKILPENNIIDTIIEQDDPNVNIEVNFNDIIPVSDNCIYYDTGNEKVIVFLKPISILSNIKNIANECNIISDYDYLNNYKMIIALSKNYKPMQVIENFDEKYNILKNKTGFQEYLDNINNKFNKFVRFLFSGKLLDIFDTSSPEEKKYKKLKQFIKKQNRKYKPDNWNLSNKIENFVEGMTMDNNNEEWMECDNVPIDYSGEIATYTINATSKTTDMNSNMLLKTLQVFWIIIIIVALYFTVPLLYGFLAVRSIIKISSADMEERHSQLTGLEIALSFLIIFPAIILLIYGYSNSTTDSNGNWILGKQLYINCVVSGGIMIFFWIISCIILYLKKIQDPVFLGYEEGDKNSPYLIFGDKVNLNKGFGHVFSSMIALFK